MKPTIGSLFSGIGGLDLAAHWAGFETAWFVEKEPFCQKVLNRHWPNTTIYSDVFECHNLPHVDMIVGGFPCQPFSVAGNRRGRNDERFLLPEMLRIVREVQPYAVLFENVPGFPSLNDGTEFKYLLGTLAEMGFDAQWGHIRASDAGAPHRRERWFCVAYPEHDGNLAAAFIGCDAETVHRVTQGADTASELAGSDSAGIASERIMGYPTSAGLEGRNGDQSTLRESTRPNQTELGNIELSGLSGFAWGRSGAQLADGYTQSRGRQAQPRIRGTAHGIPGRLDFVGFPARPGEPQHAYEPSRTAPSTKETKDRIKALGNAVVPQVAYPIFAALMEWFQENE